MKTKLPSITKIAFFKPSLFLAVLFSLTINFVSAQVSCAPLQEVTLELGENGSVTFIAKSAIPNEECFEELVDPESLAVSELNQYGDPILFKQQETFTAPGVYPRSLKALGYNGAGIIGPLTITVVGDVNVTPIEIVSETITDETCTQASGIDLEVTPNDGSVTYLWSNGATTQDISNIEAGEYTVTLSKEGTDAVTKIYTVNSSVTPLEISLEASNAKCQGAANGSISSTVSGGCEPYTYSWNTGATSSNLEAINAGEYTLTVTDAKGRSVNATTTVVEPEALNVNIAASTINATTCAFNGNVNLLYGYPKNNTKSVEITTEVTGGNESYTYAWEPAEFLDDSTSANPVFFKKKAPKTEYEYYDLTVTITDSEGCTVTKDVTLTALNVKAKTKKRYYYYSHCPKRKKKKVLVCFEGETLKVKAKNVQYYLDNGACLGSCFSDDEFTFDYETARTINTETATTIINDVAVNVFPNPSQGKFEISLRGYESAQAVLIDITGKVLEQKTISESIENTIGNDNLPKGPYFLRITTADETIVKKLIVK